MLRIATIGIEHGEEIVPQNRQRCGASAILKFRDCGERRLLAQAFDVCAGKTLRAVGKIFEVDVGGQRHTLATKPQDGRAILPDLVAPPGSIGGYNDKVVDMLIAEAERIVRLIRWPDLRR